MACRGHARLSRSLQQSSACVSRELQQTSPAKAMAAGAEQKSSSVWPPAQLQWAPLALPCPLEVEGCVAVPVHLCAKVPNAGHSALPALVSFRD
ncbi:hypothetical protein HaLaN_19414 [Haematococcus lacustris]|uniref:Uncharacterized protein n=1 Tax=Haematococcus lacustris TaxID=44745 RepID=A0A699ZJ56_HAELA|nr:hypothetical protein HaLaN_19414 [Haematococcus lacustris]